MLIKSALRDWLLVSYGMISILVISRCAAPLSGFAGLLHGKACHTILRSLCSLTNRVPLPPHPRDRIKHLEASLRKRLYSKHGLLCPLEEGERWWRQPPKRECISDARRAVVKVFYKRAPSINVRRPPQPSAAKPLSNLRTLGAIATSNFRTFKPVRACP